MQFVTETKDDASSEYHGDNDRIPPVHPHAEYSDFKKNPPIPILNIVIDNRTLEIVEDRAGQPW